MLKINQGEIQDGKSYELSWGPGTLANERTGTGLWDQSEAPGKLESWCFLRREKWVSTSQFVIVAGKYEEGLESWARSRSKPRCSKPRRGSDHRGEKNWESFSQVIREFVVGQRFIFPRKIGGGGQMSPGLNRRCWKFLLLRLKTLTIINPTPSLNYQQLVQKGKINIYIYRTRVRRQTIKMEIGWRRLSLPGLFQVQ